jgi:hypothetical protein
LPSRSRAPRRATGGRPRRGTAALNPFSSVYGRDARGGPASVLRCDDASDPGAMPSAGAAAD